MRYVDLRRATSDHTTSISHTIMPKQDGSSLKEEWAETNNELLTHRSHQKILKCLIRNSSSGRFIPTIVCSKSRSSGS